MRALGERQEEIFDYSFRVYEDCPADFIYARHLGQGDKYDAICGKEALEFASYWLSSLTLLDDSDLVIGGRVKLSRDLWVERYRSDDDLTGDSVEVRPSGVAAYLHDEPDFLPM